MKVIIKNFQKKIPINPKRIKKTILKVLSSEGKGKPGEITVCLVNDKKIKELNLKYLHINRPTDVLVFDLAKPRDTGRIFADIIISADTAKRNAAYFKTSPLDEVNLYAAHGVLHALGYNDVTAKERALMHKKEKAYVNTQD